MTMFKNLLQIYSLALCFFLSIFLLVTMVFAFDNLIYISFPKYRFAESLIDYSSNDLYIKRQNKLDQGILKAKDEDEIKKIRKKEKNIFIQRSKYSKINDLIANLVWIAVSLMFFMIHWNIYKRHKE